MKLKKRAEREKKNIFKQNYGSSICFFLPLPKIFSNDDFQLKVLLRAKEGLSISFFLFPPPLMYREAVISSQGLCRNCLMLNPDANVTWGQGRN